MTAFDPLDAWFEKGFRIRKQRPATVKGDRIRGGGGKRPVPVGQVKFSGNAKAGNARAVIRRAPEVLVKITGSSSGTDTAKHHIDYISRNGDVELENERGEVIDRKDLMRELKASQAPSESGKREFLHVLFSMPPGTPENELKDSVREFCKEEFANRQYVIDLHRDTDHVHCHVCVGTRDMYRANEPRLSPKKADLSRWCLGFADKLREHGVEAAASERHHRFQHRRPEHPVVRQIRAENPDSAVYNQRRAERQRLAGKAPRPHRTPKVYKHWERKYGRRCGQENARRIRRKRQLRGTGIRRVSLAGGGKGVGSRGSERLGRQSTRIVTGSGKADHFKESGAVRPGKDARQGERGRAGSLAFQAGIVALSTFANFLWFILILSFQVILLLDRSDFAFR
jgi:hypothetical protein